MKKLAMVGAALALVAAVVAGGVALAVCGGISLTGTYPLGTNLSGDGWHYCDIPLSHDTS